MHGVFLRMSIAEGQPPAQVVQLSLQGGQALRLALVHVVQLGSLALAQGSLAVSLLGIPASHDRSR